MSKSLPEKEERTVTITPEQTAEDARRFIEEAEPRRHGDTRESWLARTAAKVGFNAGRLSRLYYREIRRIPADEYLRLERHAQQAQQRREARRAYIAQTQAMVEASGGCAAELALDLARLASEAADRLEGLDDD